jgi:hypothetical protein
MEASWPSLARWRVIGARGGGDNEPVQDLLPGVAEPGLLLAVRRCAGVGGASRRRGVRQPGEEAVRTLKWIALCVPLFVVAGAALTGHCDVAALLMFITGSAGPAAARRCVAPFRILAPLALVLGLVVMAAIFVYVIVREFVRGYRGVGVIVAAVVLASLGCSESPEGRAARIVAECRATIRAEWMVSHPGQQFPDGYGEGITGPGEGRVGGCVATRGARP